MASWSRDRQAAMGGIVAMVLLIVGNFIYGQPPKFAASAAKVTSFYTDHHRTILIGMILTGLAIPFYIWFIAHLALAIRGPLGASVALGGLLVAASAATGDALTAAASQAAKTGIGAGTTRALFQLSTMAYSRLFWAGIAVAIPIALAASKGALRPWVVWIGWIQAVLFLLGGASLKSGGFFSPDGGMAIVAYIAYFVGTAAIAYAMWQSSPATAEAPSTATSPI